MSLAFATLWMLTVPGAAPCEVTLRGHQHLIADVVGRLDLERIAGTRCSSAVVHVAPDPNGVYVGVQQTGERFERVVPDVLQASLLIESRVLVPEEAAMPKRVPIYPANHRPRPRGEPIVLVSSVDPRVAAERLAPFAPYEAAPRKKKPREPVRAKRSRVVTPKAPNPTRRATQMYTSPLSDASAKRGLDIRLAGLAEATLSDDGNVWLGPAAEFSFSDGTWAGGVLARYGRSPSARLDGELIEVEPSVGRDIRFARQRLRFEPRLTLSVRSIQASGVNTYLSTCGTPTCSFTPGQSTSASTKWTASSVAATLGARATIVYDIAGPLSLWTAAALSAPFAKRVEAEEGRSDVAFGFAGRFSAGARLQL
ncbi:MAG: hypothetical protein RIT81_29610 [Deltaproteobacteria bacterium]